MSLIDKRILIVTGKGGTGKTTVSATLGVLAARQGKQTVLVECNGTQHIPTLFDRPPSTYVPSEILPGLSVMRITSDEALEDYIVQQIKIRSLYNLVFRNRIMGPFMDAVPGLHDAAHMGKVFDLTREKTKGGSNRWDLIIVDAPATGHGLGLLASPKSMMDLTQRGPIFEGVRIVQEVIADASQTGIILTCLPEPMPVNETVELYDALDIHRDQVVACVLNQMDTTVMPHLEEWDIGSTVLQRHADASIQEAVTWAGQWIERRKRQVQATEHLHAHLGIPIVHLPLVFQASMGIHDVERLANSMENA